MAYAAYVAGEKLTAAKLNERLVSWASWDDNAGGALNDSFNVTTMVRSSTGKFDVTWDIDFANAGYACLATNGDPSANPFYCNIRSFTPGSVQVYASNSTPSASNSRLVMVLAVGDQS